MDTTINLEIPIEQEQPQIKSPVVNFFAKFMVSFELHRFNSSMGEVEKIYSEIHKGLCDGTMTQETARKKIEYASRLIKKMERIVPHNDHRNFF